jgi:hypothetical protein
MNFLDIVSGIPLWVYPLLAALIFIGVRALNTRYIPLPLAMIAPVAFITWGLFTFKSSSMQGIPLVSFLGSAIFGLIIAFATTWKQEVVVDKVSRKVCLQGSYVPLIRNLSIFAAKFTLTFMIAVRPDLRDVLVPWDLSVSGISSGYFAGWAFWLLSGYFKGTKSGSSGVPA